MSMHSFLLLSALNAALSTLSLAGNVTFGKVYHSGEFLYDDRNLHAIVSPTQSRYRRSPCSEDIPVIDPLSIDLQLSGPSDYQSVRFSFNVSPKTISKADCKQARTNKTAGQWSQGSGLLMEFYRTAAAELGVMSAVLRKPPTYGLTIDTKTDPSKAVLTINDAKEGTSNAYVCTVHAGKCASVTTSFLIQMPDDNHVNDVDIDHHDDNNDVHHDVIPINDCINYCSVKYNHITHADLNDWPRNFSSLHYQAIVDNFRVRQANDICH